MTTTAAAEELCVDLAVVGAGPAGLAAAQTAAGLGLQVCLVELSPDAGGQYGRQLPPQFGGCSGRPPSAGAQWLPHSLVWELRPGWEMSLAGPHAVRRIHAGQVILAPGARDRALPFPGWTLPGVITAGCALALLKGQGILPGRRILLDGTGPLQFALAGHLLAAGARVVGVCDANRLSAGSLRLLAAMRYQPARALEAAAYLSRMLGRAVPWWRGWSLRRAEGDGGVAAAIICRVDAQGHPIPGTDRRLEVDTICLGFGFSPNQELARMAGAQHAWDPGRQEAPVVRDEWMETSCPGLYVAGDGAGIHGAHAADSEGRLAGLAAARRAGRLSAAQAQALSRRWRAALQRQARFAAALDQAFPALPGLAGLITDDTVICRCEELTAAEIRRAIAAGAGTAEAVKCRTRAGMGRCQGRNCRASIEAMIAAATGSHPAACRQPSVRPPALPVALADLMSSHP